MASVPGSATFRFYGSLTDHLPPGQRHGTVLEHFAVPASVKDMIESLGVPHSEVDLILVNGEPADFAQVVRDGNRVAVYPFFRSIDISPLGRLLPEQAAELKFVLDVHLGRLAGHLRMLGFDTWYSNDTSDPELARTASEEGRILLTRDRGLLKHSTVTRGYWLRATDARRQAAEVVDRYELAGLIQPLTRCLVCNTVLTTASRSGVSARVPPRVLESCQEFRECPGCKRVYWEGTPTARMRHWIQQLSNEQ